MLMIHIDLLFYNVIYNYAYIRFKWFGMNESVAHIEEDRIFFEMWYLRKNPGHSDHICCIKYKSSGVPVIRMLIIRSRKNNYIGFMFPYQLNLFKPVFI